MDCPICFETIHHNNIITTSSVKRA